MQRRKKKKGKGKKRDGARAVMKCRVVIYGMRLCSSLSLCREKAPIRRWVHKSQIGWNIILPPLPAIHLRIISRNPLPPLPPLLMRAIISNQQ